MANGIRVLRGAAMLINLLVKWPPNVGCNPKFANYRLFTFSVPQPIANGDIREKLPCNKDRLPAEFRITGGSKAVEAPRPPGRQQHARDRLPATITQRIKAAVARRQGWRMKGAKQVVPQ